MSNEFKIKHLKAYIENKKKRILDVYGTTKDGSVGLAYAMEIVPLEKELKELEKRIQ